MQIIAEDVRELERYLVSTLEKGYTESKRISFYLRRLMDNPSLTRINKKAFYIRLREHGCPESELEDLAFFSDLNKSG